MFLRKAWSLCSQSKWADVLQEQQLLYNKLVNMSCVTSMSVYYGNITLADRSGKAPFSRHTWADRRAQRMLHMSTSWNHAAFLHSVPTTSLEMADFVGQMERGPKTTKLSSQPSVCLLQDRDWTGQGVTELSLCCSTGTKSCPWQQCPFHCTHIPWFAHGRGQNPYLPLEISFEAWRDGWERERHTVK